MLRVLPRLALGASIAVACLLACPMGRRHFDFIAPVVRVRGEEHARVFGGLKHEPEFRRLRAICSMSDGAEPGSAYVHDISLSADESEKAGSMNHTLAGLSANWLEYSQHYRPSAFWFWNSDMGAEQMKETVDAMARAQIREVVLHPIQGLTVEYLSDDYFSRCRAAMGMLSQHGIRVWIYDEFGWPSGNAGGLLLRGRPDLSGWYLQFSRDAGGRIRAVPTRYDRVLDNTVGAPWARSEAGYLDTLNSEAVAEFIRLTHERYWTEFGRWFGGTIRGFFTDEPVTMMDARSERWGIWGAVGLPWTPRFPALFKDRFGYDIEPLYAGLAGDGPSKPKQDYWALVKDLHTEAYHRQIARWCHEHGVLYTGHVGEDQVLQQVRFGGSVFQSLSAMDIPGVDYLGHTGPPDDRWSDLALVPSVALHSGRDRVFCEAFGIAPLDVRLSTMLSTCQMLGLHGVNDIALMGFHQSLDGIRKQTYWPPLFVQSPWWPFYPAFRDAVARSVALVSLGKRRSRYALLYPQCELEQKDLFDFDTASVGHGNPGGRKIDILGRSIYDAGETFDFVFPEMLEEASVRDGRISFPHASYDALLAPGDIRFFDEDIRHLRRLSDAGGAIWQETIDEMAARIESAQPSWSSHLAFSGGRPAQLRVFRFEYPDGALFAIRNSGTKSVTLRITSPLSLTRWDPETGDLTACVGGLTETLRAYETAFLTCTREPLCQALPAKLTTEPVLSKWNVTTELPNTARLSGIQFRHSERGWLSAADPTIFKKLEGRAVTGIPHDFAGLSRVEFRGEFIVRSLPESLGIVYEGGHLESLHVNGQAVDLLASSALPYWDASCRHVGILGLTAAGRNTVTGVLKFHPFETAIQNDVVYAFHPMPACDVFVAGRFVLSGDVLSPPDPAPVGLPLSFAEAGFGEYAGIVRMSCRVDTGADAASIRGISVSPIAEDAVEVLLNGTSLGTRLKAPYSFPVGHLPSGSHTLEIRISGTTANLFANPPPWGMAGVALLVSDRP